MTKLETLDNLVKVCIDSAERYRRAAADVGKEKLVQFFQQNEADRRSGLVQHLAEFQRHRLKPGKAKMPRR